MSGADASRVGRILADFPSQCRQAATLTPSPPLGRRPFRHVMVAGMGGSAIAGDLVAALATDRLPVPVTVWRGYGVPSFVGQESLIVAISYSGNTEETISALDAAHRRGAACAVLTSGGTLADLGRRYGLSLVSLPGGLMPRLALGYLLFPLLAIFESVGLPPAPEAERAEALAVLDAMGRELAVEADNEAMQLAARLLGRIPVIYGSALTGAAAYRWKSEVEEHAKLLAFHGTLPEADHNEIEGWRDSGAAGFHAVFLRDRREDEVEATRVRVTQELIRARAGGITDVWPRGEGKLARLLSLVYLGDWVSYHLALLRGVDPWSVPALDEVKRRVRGAKSP
ncbi:MAG: bifunctional phosphoglucose/phosphomannose isomerase [Candidatus Rokubacteria bacterium]|nr:bifunctional phosphoglucose/phosphomannose isomerase [Candidatus Rokubacteria bacterium]